MSPKQASAALTWVADVPLVTNPVILRAMVLVLGLAYLLITGIFAALLAAGDHLERLAAFMLAMLIGFGAVAALLVLVMLVVFGNRMRCRFIIDDDGVSSLLVDRRAEIAGSLAVLTGAASVAGAGLAAAGAQREYTRWSRVAGADYFPERHFIRLRAAGRWPVGAIHCTAESYPAAAAKVRERLERQAS